MASGVSSWEGHLTCPNVFSYSTLDCASVMMEPTVDSRRGPMPNLCAQAVGKVILVMIEIEFSLQRGN